jgi:hypothetical protein
VREARDFAARAALDWGVDDNLGDVRLVTSELATNAVQHARTGFSVVVRVLEHAVVVEVTDGSSELPVWARALSCHGGGRGLRLVDALSTRWGADRLPMGKTVWAVLGPERRLHGAGRSRGADLPGLPGA